MTAVENVAARVERVRRQVDTCAWVAILLGLAFTMTNVQVFAAAGSPAWSLPWLAAWLLDPMVSLLLIAVLRAEQVTARWQVPTGWRVTATKWGAFAATYLMNTWASWRDESPSGVVLHSVPPLVVLLGAEVAPELRDRLTAAVAAAEAALRSQASVGQASAPQPSEVAAPPSGDADPDPRVLDLARRHCAGEQLTGSDVAAELSVSPRTGRRLIAAAVTYAEQLSDAGHQGLHVVTPEGETG